MIDLTSNLQQDLISFLAIGKRDIEMLLNSARTQHSLVNNIGSVSCCDNEHHLTVINTIQLIQQCIDHSFSHLITLILTLGS